MTLARGEKTFSSSPSQPLQLQLVPLSPLKASFCFIHEHFFFFNVANDDATPWLANKRWHSDNPEEEEEAEEALRFMRPCGKEKNNKTLSSFHASFWRTGFFWTATLLNLICHSVWLKVCLVPSILLSFTWAPQSSILIFQPESISSTHPSLALPFISLFSSLPLSRYAHLWRGNWNPAAL